MSFVMPPMSYFPPLRNFIMPSKSYIPPQAHAHAHAPSELYSASDVLNHASNVRTYELGSFMPILMVRRRFYRCLIVWRHFVLDLIVRGHYVLSQETFFPDLIVWGHFFAGCDSVDFLAPSFCAEIFAQDLKLWERFVQSLRAQRPFLIGWWRFLGDHRVLGTVCAG